MTVRVRNSRSWLTTTVPARRPVTKRLQALQAVQVEVVGRLVEQEDVVAGEQQRGEAGAGRLAAGERGHRLVQADGQAERGGDLLGPLVEVGAAEVEPALQARRRTRRRRPGAPSTSAWVASSIARWASATPVRRARKSRTVSPGRRSGSCGRWPTVARRRGEPQLALLGRGAARRASGAAWTCPRRWRRPARSRRRARRRGRARRRASGRRGRRRGSWRRGWQSSEGDPNCRGGAPRPVFQRAIGSTSTVPDGARHDERLPLHRLRRPGRCGAGPVRGCRRRPRACGCGTGGRGGTR